MHEASFVSDFAVVLSVAAVTAVIARALRQPTILGYLFAGLLVGPYLPLPLFADLHRIEALAEFGVALVMFAVGLEFRISKLTRVLPVSGVTGLVQVGFLLWCGFTIGRLLGWSDNESIFLGGSLCISSTMVVTRVFGDKKVSKEVSDHVLGILVIQDVLAIILIAALTAVAAGGGLEPRALLLVLARLGAVLMGLLAFGLLLVPRAVRWVARMQSPELLVVVASGLCFAIGAMADRLGFSVALGAFVAGILVAESGREERVEHVVAPLRDIFAAVFFVSIGMSVDPRQAIQHLPIALGLTVLVIAAQLFSVTVAGLLSGNGLRKSLQSALALGQIGEFSFIISGIGIAAGIVRADLRPILITVAVLTAFTTPLFIGSAERVVRFVDHKLPPRVHRLISLYERWFERWRSRSGGRSAPAGRNSHAVRNLAFDAIASTLVVGLALTWTQEATTVIAAETGWTTRQARGAFGALTLLVVLPLILGLVRNALALSKGIADEVAPKTPDAPPGERITRRLVRSGVHLLVTLGVGVPAVAVLRPLLPGPFGLPALVLLLVVLGLFMYREVRGLEKELRSGTAAVASRLAVELGERNPPTLYPGLKQGPTVDDTDSTMLPGMSHTLPGLDSIKGWRIPEGAWGAGRSLSELDLRARSGAAVVAIRRNTHVISLPTGSDRLEAGDVLGLLGGAQSIAEAQTLILSGPPPEEQTTDGDRPSADEVASPVGGHRSPSDRSRDVG